jgi:hypothetical protein
MSTRLCRDRFGQGPGQGRGIVLGTGRAQGPPVTAFVQRVSRRWSVNKVHENRKSDETSDHF